MTRAGRLLAVGGYDPDFVISLTSADAAPLAVERDANEAGVVGDARRYRRAVVVEHPSSDGDSSAPKYCIGFVEEPDAQDEDEEARKEMARSGVHQGLGGAALVVADMDADSDGVWEMSGQDVAPPPRARRPPVATSQQWMHHHHHDHRTDVARSASGASSGNDKCRMLGTNTHLVNPAQVSARDSLVWAVISTPVSIIGGALCASGLQA